jgi:phosphosulfolactate synthase (CoM biosynthesis protein A)
MKRHTARPTPRNPVATQMTPIAGAQIFRDPRRTQKPRKTGLTQVLDKGLSIAEVEGMLEVAASYVDVVKFGWATSVVVENFEAKLETFRRHDINVCCGGSHFELAVHRKLLNEYVAFLLHHGFKFVEVSDGTIQIPLAEKLRHIERLAKHFTIFSEVGRKDPTHVVAAKRWVDQIKSELAAGSWKVIVEGRESGTVGPRGHPLWAASAAFSAAIGRGDDPRTQYLRRPPRRFPGPPPTASTLNHAVDDHGHEQRRHRDGALGQLCYHDAKHEDAHPHSQRGPWEQKMADV